MVESTNASKSIVVITGVTGFLGAHVCLAFLKACDEDGKPAFRVRGTVRSKDNKEKIDPIKKSFGEYWDLLELVEADLNDTDSMTAAIEDATYVIHVAQPMPFEQMKHEDELIKPTLAGMNAVLEACRANKVRHLVVTASTATCSTPTVRPDVFDESHWSDPDLLKDDAYSKAKTLGEKAAWDYVEALPTDEKFALTTILPGFIVGPVLVGGSFASGQAIQMLMGGTLPGLPRMNFGVVDVRDCAQAHLNAIKIEEAKNKRFILAKECWWFADIGKALQAEFGPQGYKVTTGEFRYCTFRFFAVFSAKARTVLPFWGDEKPLDNSQSKQVLGIEYSRTVQDSLNEMAYSMIEAGLIEDKRKPVEDAKK